MKNSEVFQKYADLKAQEALIKGQLSELKASVIDEMEGSKEVQAPWGVFRTSVRKTFDFSGFESILVKKAELKLEEAKAKQDAPYKETEIISFKTT